MSNLETVASKADGIESNPPETIDELPQVFGRYLLLQRLSRGGMGEIFLAKLGEIQGFEKLVIIKKILPHLAANSDFIKRFIDEAQVAIKLTHSNIAPVFEVGRVGSEYFLAIEYVEGRDLRKVIARQHDEAKRLPIDLCFYIGRELAAGLTYAHRRTDETGRSLSVVHCDISPPNVMVSFDGEVKIIDFGIAKSAIRVAGTNPNMGFGKFGYMAPEQLIRGAIIDRRADIYAAGVVLYELLTGERMLQFPEGADYRQMAKLVTAGKIPLLSERNPRLGTEFDEVVMRALATRPDDRYQNAEELRDTLAKKLAERNPTLSADSLANYVRTLFRDEITEEKNRIASLKAVDLTPFKDELTAISQHTVSIARAGSINRIGRSLSALSSRHRRGSLQFLQPWLRTLLMVVGGVIGGGLLIWIGAQVSTPAKLGQPRPAAFPPPPSLPIPVVTLPSTTVSPIIIPPVVLDPAASGERHRHHGVALRSTPPRATVTSEAVQAKFGQVKREYSVFKAKYGPILQDDWNAIAQEITFGKADKYPRLDSMLDSLRRSMASARAR